MVVWRVLCVVCSVVWMSVRVRSVVAWWIERGKEGVKDTVNKNEKEPQIPSTPFPSFFFHFSLFLLFPNSLSFLPSNLLHAHAVSMSMSTPSSCTGHVHIRKQHHPRATQHPFRFFVFLSCSNSLLCCFFHNNLLSLSVTQFYHTPHIKQRSFFTSAIQFSMTYDSHIK